MYIESVPNRNSPPAILLRESYRDAGKVRKRTLANLSKWPPALVEGLRVLLKGGTAVADLTTTFDIVRSRPHGHVVAVLGTLRKLRLDRTLAAAPSPERERAIALIVARILAPGSKLATARGLAADTARDSLAEMLDIENVNEDELYAAMDWLLETPGRHRATPGQTPLERRRPGALRPDLHLPRRALLSAGQARLLARWQAGEAANRVRLAVQPRGDVRSRSRSSRATPPTRAPWERTSTSCAALRSVAGGARRRPRDAHRSAHP